MLLLAGGGLLAALVLLAALALSGQPDVPPQLPGWPSLGFLYLQLLRAAVKRKAPPSGLTGKPIQVCVRVWRCSNGAVTLWWWLLGVCALAPCRSHAQQQGGSWVWTATPPTCRSARVVCACAGAAERASAL
jgi:hypothetical protein